jgi:hypothetical protein
MNPYNIKLMLSLIIAYYKDTKKDYSDIKNNYIEQLNITNKIVLYQSSIMMLHSGKVYNPPYFLDIFIVDDEQKYEERHFINIFNMVIIGGHIIIAKKHSRYFENINNTNNINNVKHIEKIKSKIYGYDVFKKISNFVLINKKLRPPIDFIIMGTQKSGTTSVQKNLQLHDDIYLHGDELHYFDLFLSKGLEWYKSNFDYKKKLIGEKTPELMYLESTFPYIQMLNPNVKIIIFLRNPIDRAYSAWKMMKHDYNEVKTFEECILDEQENRIGENKNFNTSTYHHLQKGLYYQQIMNILKWFPRQNLLVLLFEHFIEDIDNQYKKIYDFLNINTPTDVTYTKERVSFDTSSINSELYDTLIPFYKNDVKKLEEFLGYKTLWNKFD